MWGKWSKYCVGPGGKACVDKGRATKSCYRGLSKNKARLKSRAKEGLFFLTQVSATLKRFAP